MKKVAQVLSVLLVSAAVLSSCEKENDQTFTVITASGNISAKVDEFRMLLGSQLNTTPGATGGRREINWDGIPDQLLATPLPSNFFNPVDAGAPASLQRGLVYSSVNDNFQVSKTNFNEVNSDASTQFAAFSGQKTFSNISSNLWDVGFEVPGQPIAASVRGFGLVFSDVDLPDNSFLEFFDGNKSLGRFYVPVHDASSSLSFLGVYFKNDRITRVRVSHGNGTLNSGEKDISNGGTKDLVILDDFLYDEPISQ
ncbi:MAG TPA: hypothetical protein VEV87_02760 [Chitinophagaceae bacterium]|nr:hypothetical protein [Chitinophagaceae bacterium]